MKKKVYKMYYVVMDIGCAECGESSNLVGIFTSEKKARDALKEYKVINHLDTYSDDHEFFIYRIDTLDKIYQNSYDHLVD